MQPGQRLILAGSGVAVRVSGIAQTGTYGHADVAYTPLATWQQASAGGRGQFSAVALRLRSGTDVASADAAAGTMTYTKAGSYAGSPSTAAGGRGAGGCGRCRGTARIRGWPSHRVRGPVSLHAADVMTAAVLLVGFGMIGALAPVRRIARVDPVTTLGVER